jgi:hypothetical protein
MKRKSKEEKGKHKCKREGDKRQKAAADNPIF